MFYTALILMFIGLCLLALELFVPSAGILGIFAGCLIVAAVVTGFMDGVQSGLLMLVLSMIVVPAMLFLMIKIWPHTPIGRSILTDEKVLTDILPTGEYYEKMGDLVGKTGAAKSKMLPSGQIVIDGEKYDAVSDGFAIEAGDHIQVVAVKQNRIYVQPTSDSSTDSAEQATSSDNPLDQPIGDFGLESDAIDDLLDS
jgi:membrane-bound ClpP family serine protease